jgi:hypothetical protein
MINQPLMYKTGMNNHMVYYSPSFTKLEPGKKYSWQVQRLKDGEIIERTDTWSFFYKKPTSPKVYKYAELGKEENAALYQVEDGNIYFCYFNDKPNQIEFKIYYTDKSGEVKALTAQNDINSNSQLNTFERGDNRMKIDLTKNNISSGLYKITFEDTTNKKYYLNFKY